MTGGVATRVVLKIGGSVLRDDAGWDAAVEAVTSERGAGAHVLVVVSATAGTTDGLLSSARRRSAAPRDELLSSLLRTGEESAVALLAIALEEAGIPAGACSATRLGLTVAGPRTQAEPVGVDTGRLDALLARHGVVVVPGFVGRHVDGGDALLGRGGSDMTAIYLACRLGARCRLIKDVGGLFTADPARSADALRYLQATWEVALELGGSLIQPRAIELAERHGRSIEVGDAEGRYTLVGPGPCRLETSRRGQDAKGARARRRSA